MLLCFNFINDIKKAWRGHMPHLKGEGIWVIWACPFWWQMMWCRTALLSISSPLYFPAHLPPPPTLSSLPHYGCKDQKEKRREKELIRKQNGKENGGETVWNIKRGAYSKMGRGENWEWEREIRSEGDERQEVARKEKEEVWNQEKGLQTEKGWWH